MTQTPSFSPVNTVIRRDYDHPEVRVVRALCDRYRTDRGPGFARVAKMLSLNRGLLKRVYDGKPSDTVRGRIEEFRELAKILEEQ